MNRAWVLTLLLLATTASASPVRTCGGKALFRWPLTPDDPTVRYYFDSTDATLQANVNQAFALWSSVETSYLRLVQVQNPEDAQIRIDMQAGSFGDRAGRWDPRFDSECRLTYCGIMFGSDAANDLYSLLHETGHCLGLGHSIVHGTVMGLYSHGASTLALDDRMAITTLYPRESNASLPVGCGTIQKSSSGGDPRVLELVILIGLVAMAFKFPLRSRSSISYRTPFPRSPGSR